MEIGDPLSPDRESISGAVKQPFFLAQILVELSIIHV
jgi:hypothetical protein